jgi:type II secretion system protein H
VSRQGTEEDERGFTLVEVMIVIILMGIVFAIASSTWFGVTESRRVDSATNQLAADLRLAHSRAMNRLTPQTVTLTGGSSDYTMTGGDTRDLDEVTGGDLVEVNTSVTVVFNADGSAVVTGPNPIAVEASNDATNNHTIGINTATSRIQVVP